MGRFREDRAEIYKKVEQSTLDFIVKAFAEDFRTKGWEAIPESMNKYLKALGVRPEYLQESSQQFSALREKLNNQGGLAISNHPVGYVDVPIILSILQREDFKAYVADRVYVALVNSFEANFGPEGKKFAEERLLSNDPDLGPQNFRKAVKHIKAGGVLLMHPTENRERHKVEKVEFQRGLRLFLRHINDDAMVYSFCVNPHDLKRDFPNAFSTASRFSGLASEQLLTEHANINHLRRPAIIRVDENYDTAANWKSHAQDDASLTQYYWSKYHDFSNT